LCAAGRSPEIDAITSLRLHMLHTVSRGFHPKESELRQLQHTNSHIHVTCRSDRGMRAGWLAALALAACSPTLDWRSVAVPGTQLVAELPCRPSRFQREVRVDDLRLQLFMLSCEAGGVTYGVATADVGDPARVDGVLRALRNGAAEAIRSAGSPAAALDMRGVTPFSGNSSARLQGQRPDGQAVQEAIRVFARGSQVFQASALGQTLPEAALRPFEDGLRFDLEKRAADPI